MYENSRDLRSMSIDTIEKIPDKNEFFSQYWQKKPLVIRGLIANADTLLEPNVLAGLSLMSEVDSRIIRQLEQEPYWAVEHGPFKDNRFESIGDKDWTLLVQGVERYFPHLLDLRHFFGFLPNWIFDDVMVSFASEGGSVGPHTDQYDVFLIQGQGTRTWHLGAGTEDPNCPLLPLEDIKVMANFVCDVSVELEPGDVLYVPPHFAHYGVATSACMTFSVGFRAPSIPTFLQRYAGDLLIQGEQPLFHSSNVAVSRHPGAISKEVVKELKSMLCELLNDEDVLMSSFGRWMSEPKSFSAGIQNTVVVSIPQSASGDFDEQRDKILALTPLFKTRGERYLYHGFSESSTHLSLFVEGDEFIVPSSCLPLLQDLCGNYNFSEEWCYEAMNQSNLAVELLYELVKRGYLASQEDLIQLD